jgi:hypothetical protein
MSADLAAFNLEKSRLLQKHRDELAPLAKDIKKKKVRCSLRTAHAPCR